MSSLREIQRPKTYRKVAWVKRHYFHHPRTLFSSFFINHSSSFVNVIFFQTYSASPIETSRVKRFWILKFKSCDLAKCNYCKKKSFFRNEYMACKKNRCTQTSVPAIPIASPMSASCNAGASLVPSPVTATTSLDIPLKFFTSLCLSNGKDRAITYIDNPSNLENKYIYI